MNAEQEHSIAVDQLQVGVYVYLDVGWMHHPFGFNNFKIRSEEQLRTIRQLGLGRVRWDPLRSDQQPLPAKTATAGAGGTTAAPVDAGTVARPGSEAPPELPPNLAKQARVQRLAEYRQTMARLESAFMKSIDTARHVSHSLFAQPEQTRVEAGQLVGQLVDTLLASPELAIQLMGTRPGGEDIYIHTLNVSVLAMILGRELQLPAELVRAIGMGALFHDIGLMAIPAGSLDNRAPLSKLERDCRQLHCQVGLDLGKKAGLPPAVLEIIYQHHERADGSGYPRQLKGDAIDALARVVGLVNAYDNLCNPVDVAQALTPHESLSQIFAQQRNQHDPHLLNLFIRMMGVYPPGTVVALSNEAVGLVIAVNPTRPLRPRLLLYDPQIPRHEAIILDLQDEPDINITKSLRPGQLLPEVCRYLAPRRRVSYYFDGEAGAAPRPPGRA